MDFAILRIAKIAVDSLVLRLSTCCCQVSRESSPCLQDGGCSHRTAHSLVHVGAAREVCGIIRIQNHVSIRDLAWQVIDLDDEHKRADQ